MEKKRHSILKEYFYFNQREAPPTFKETLKNLAESSSLHGIPKIVSSRQIAVKVLWCLLFLGTFTVLTTQLFDLFRTYYLYPVKTTVSLKYSALAFPAVTICNMNPIRKSQLGMSESLKLTFEKESLHGRSRRDVRGNKQLPEALLFPNKGDIEKSTESYKHLPTPPLGRQFDFLDKVLREEIKDGTGGKHAVFSSVFSQPNYIPGVRRRIRAAGAETSTGTAGSSAKSPETPTVKSGTSSDKDDSSITKSNTSSSASGTSSDLSDSSGTKTDTSKTTSGTSSDISGSSGTKTDTSKTTSGTSSDKSDSSGTKTDTSKTTIGTSSDKSDSSGKKTDTSKTTSGTSSDTTDSSGTKTDTSKTTSGTSSDKTDSSGTKTGKEDSSDQALTSKVDWEKWASWYNDYYKSTKDNKSSSASDTYQSSTGGTTEKEWNSHDPKKYVFAQMFSKKDRWDERVDHFRTVFKNENIKDRRQMGHQKENMILSASFSGVLENETSFQDLSSSEYGNCYTMSSTEYVSWGSGPSHGIKLTLNLEIDEYMPIFSTGYGIRILLHEPGTYPLPSNEGITLSPGTETNIGLRLVRISRLGKPHGDCVNGKDFARRYRMKYSKAVCYQFCRIRKAMEVCKCIPVDSPDEVNLGQLTDLSVCNVTNTSEKLCLLGVDVRFNNGEYDCDCSGPCKETVYSKTMSSRLWPTDDYLDVLMDEMCTSNYTLTSSVCANKDNLTFDQIEKYRKNFLRVLIYYEDLNYESITQEPMYEFARFVSDIGGAMGLFLGASVLSLVEFLQLLLEIFLFATKKHTQDKNRVEVLKRNHFVVEG